jgi:hypothetical protein
LLEDVVYHRVADLAIAVDGVELYKRACTLQAWARVVASGQLAAANVRPSLSPLSQVHESSEPRLMQVADKLPQVSMHESTPPDSDGS